LFIFGCVSKNGSLCQVLENKQHFIVRAKGLSLSSSTSSLVTSKKLQKSFKKASKSFKMKVEILHPVSDDKEKAEAKLQIQNDAMMRFLKKMYYFGYLPIQWLSPGECSGKVSI